jgi:hypothetical protein
MPKMKIPADRLVWGRDPFTLSDFSPEEVSPIQDLQLMGITCSSDTSAYKAIINDEIVTVGSKLGAFTVVEISEHIVKVQDKKGTYDLRIREEM